MKMSPNRRCVAPVRVGTAMVEFALVFPILFLFMIASVEFARAKQVMNATAFAAYQGCRQAIVPGSTTDDATTAAQAVLDHVSIKTSSIAVTSEDVAPSTETITVSVSVNLGTVGWLTSQFTRNTTITRRCTLTRERTS